jgi:hypothetical protein
VAALLDEGELLKILDRMNLNQMAKVVPGVFKPKFYCCVTHHAYRKAFEDTQWLNIENQARDNMMAVDEDRELGRKQCMATLAKILKEGDFQT